MIDLTKVVEPSDWDDPDFSMALRLMCGAMFTGDIPMHRKQWEWTMGRLSFEKHGLLNNRTVMLGVGAGIEAPIYLYTKDCRYVLATDLYYTERGWGDAGIMLVHPGVKKPIGPGYDANRLGVMHMDGRNLRFPDESFDAIFSYGSIEHFGGGDKTASTRSLGEMARVLKPGGVISLATEVCLEGERALPRLREKYKALRGYFPRYRILDEMFTREELEHYILHYAETLFGLDVSNEIKYPDVSSFHKDNYPSREYSLPHLYLRTRYAPEVVFGSVHICMRK